MHDQLQYRRTKSLSGWFLGPRFMGRDWSAAVARLQILRRTEAEKKASAEETRRIMGSPGQHGDKLD